MLKTFQSFRFVLFPLSVIYGSAIWVRNKLFDKNLLHSASFNFPVICIGNLAVGGTGKTPMAEHLIRILKDDYKVATLSRGYKRKTKGFAIAGKSTTALDIGDEPMQFHNKFPDVTIAVAEERLVAIPQLLHAKPETQVIILDDAFQHRQVRAGLNILLTEYKNLYTRDFILPAGDLRDVQESSKRADIIIVTKCPGDLSAEEKDQLIKELEPLKHQQVFFTTIVYENVYHLFSREERTLQPETAVLLVCGIANPKPIKEMLNAKLETYEMMRFNDHHIFTISDLKEIRAEFSKMEASDKIIITTEKDGVRLEKYQSELNNLPVYVLPMKHHFLFDEELAFNHCVKQFIGSFDSTAISH